MNGQYDFEFGVLLETVLKEPEKLNDIIRENPDILEAKNRAGENVLRWCALENLLDEVEVLRSFGSSIQSSALSEAICHGHTYMVSLLLELGAEPDLLSCRQELSSDMLSSRERHIIKDHFKAYGYEL